MRIYLDPLRGRFSGKGRKADSEQPMGDSIFHPRVGVMRKKRTEILWKVVSQPQQPGVNTSCSSGLSGRKCCLGERVLSIPALTPGARALITHSNAPLGNS